MYKHILISTDGSETAQKGVDQGLALAKALGAQVTLITVTEPFPVYASAAGGWIVFAARRVSPGISPRCTAAAFCAGVAAASTRWYTEAPNSCSSSA